MEEIDKKGLSLKTSWQCRRIKLVLTAEGLEILKHLEVMDNVKNSSFFISDGSKRIIYLYFVGRIRTKKCFSKLNGHILYMNTFTEDEADPILEGKLHLKEYQPGEAPKKKLKLDDIEQKHPDLKLKSFQKIQSKARVAWLELSKKDQDKSMKYAELLANANSDESMKFKYLQLYHLFQSQQAKLESYHQFAQDIRKTLSLFEKKDEILFECEIPTMDLPEYLNKILHLNEENIHQNIPEMLRLEQEISQKQEYESGLKESLKRILDKFDIPDQIVSDKDAKGLVEVLENVCDPIKMHKDKENKSYLEENQIFHDQKLREEITNEFIQKLKQQDFFKSIAFTDEIYEDQTDDQLKWDKILTPLNRSWMNLHQEIQELQENLRNMNQQNMMLTQEINTALDIVEGRPNGMTNKNENERHNYLDMASKQQRKLSKSIQKNYKQEKTTINARKVKEFQKERMDVLSTVGGLIRYLIKQESLENINDHNEFEEDILKLEE